VEHIPFGVFNPRFYGVSVFLVNDERRDAWERYYQTDDVAQWANVNSIAAMEDVSTLSAVDHELRHFHDFLLSPLGVVAAGLRMQASINGFQAMKALELCSGKFVPVPLTRWMQWDTSTRQSWTYSNGSFLGIASPEDMVKLPHISETSLRRFQAGAHAMPSSHTPEERLSDYAQAAAGAYSNMETLRKRSVSQFNIEVSADHIFEAAAHLVQAQAIWSGQGEEATQRFLEFIQNSESPHLRPFQVLWKVLLESAPPSIQRMSELFTWMLLGPGELLTSNGHPANRYFQVLTLAAQLPHEDIFRGAISSAQYLASASASADSRRQMYANLAHTLQGGYFDSLFAVANTWYDEQRIVKSKFINDPESLAHPHRYLHEKCFPLPFFETRFGQMMHQREDQLNSPDHRVIALDPECKRIIAYISKLDSSQQTQILDDVLSARIVTHMVDFLFSDEPTFDLYENWCRSLIQPIIKKRLVSVY
jgi:hypothetical protein